MGNQAARTMPKSSSNSHGHGCNYRKLRDSARATGKKGAANARRSLALRLLTRAMADLSSAAEADEQPSVRAHPAQDAISSSTAEVPEQPRLVPTGAPRLVLTGAPRLVPKGAPQGARKGAWREVQMELRGHALPESLRDLAT